MSGNIVVPKDRVTRFAEEWGLEVGEAEDRYTSVVKDIAAHPMVPNEDQVVELRRSYREGVNVRDGSSMMEYMAVEWQRRMAFVPEPEPEMEYPSDIPKEVSRLLCGDCGTNGEVDRRNRKINLKIIEAYLTGLKASDKCAK